MGVQNNFNEPFFSEQIKSDVVNKPEEGPEFSYSSVNSNIREASQVKFADLKQDLSLPRFGIKEWVKKHIFRRETRFTDNERLVVDKIKACIAELHSKAGELEKFGGEKHTRAMRSSPDDFYAAKRERMDSIVNEWREANTNLNALVDSLKGTRISHNKIMKELSNKKNELNNKISFSTYMRNHESAKNILDQLEKNSRTLQFETSLIASGLSNTTKCSLFTKLLELDQKLENMQNFSRGMASEGINKDWGDIQNGAEALRADLRVKIEGLMTKKRSTTMKTPNEIFSLSPSSLKKTSTKQLLQLSSALKNIDQIAYSGRKGSWRDLGDAALAMNSQVERLILGRNLQSAGATLTVANSPMEFKGGSFVNRQGASLARELMSKEGSASLFNDINRLKKIKVDGVELDLPMLDNSNYDVGEEKNAYIEAIHLQTRQLSEHQMQLLGRVIHQEFISQPADDVNLLTSSPLGQLNFFGEYELEIKNEDEKVEISLTCLFKQNRGEGCIAVRRELSVPLEEIPSEGRDFNLLDLMPNARVTDYYSGFHLGHDPDSVQSAVAELDRAYEPALHRLDIPNVHRIEKILEYPGDLEGDIRDDLMATQVDRDTIQISSKEYPEFNISIRKQDLFESGAKVIGNAANTHLGGGSKNSDILILALLIKKRINLIGINK